MVVIWSDEVRRPVLRIFAKLVLKPLFVAHVHFLLFGLQEVDKSLDKLQGTVSERYHDQHLSIKTNINLWEPKSEKMSRSHFTPFKFILTTT